MSKKQNEVYISIDIESAGPNPSNYSMLSIGACVVSDPGKNFYIEIQPITDNFLPAAIKISGLNMEELRETGVAPDEAMRRFAQWIDEAVPQDGKPLFVALNAPFDWMFVNDYFHRYLGRNPFGHSAIDVKAYYMGLKGCRWDETGFEYLSKEYLQSLALTHNALQDALDQAKLFRAMLRECSSN